MNFSETIKSIMEDSGIISKLIPKDLEKYITKIALAEKIILQDCSFEFLKGNYLIALNSIKSDINSIKYVNWSAFTEKEIENLIESAIDTAINNNELKQDDNTLKMILNTIKSNNLQISLISKKICKHPAIFKLLLEENELLCNPFIMESSINNILDEDNMKLFFRKAKIFGKNERQKDETYIDRFTKMYNVALNTLPTISSFNSVFQMLIEKEWIEERKQNEEYLQNIFEKICSQLRNCQGFEEAIESMRFTFELRLVLDNKFDDLYQAMKDYFNIYHSRIADKLEKIVYPQNVISKMSALYIAKSKENFKKEMLQNYQSWISKYFILRLDNPLITKKIIEKRQKEKFSELYTENNVEIHNFINGIYEKYGQIIDNNKIKKMIDSFIILGYSKIDSIIPSPKNYEDYLKYEKAIKLISRLNNNYIKYDDMELTNYRNIITYDNNSKKYIYNGVVFDNAAIKVFESYRQQKQIFEHIKKEIMQKAKELKVDTKIDTDSLLDDSLEKELPFTDEYFEFDDKYFFNNYSLIDFFHACTDFTNGFCPDSFLDDESFKNLINIVVNNSLIWLLLFIHDEEPYCMKDDFSKDEIIKLINNMKNITDLAKDFNFDLSNFKDLITVSKISEYSDRESIAILGKEIIASLCQNDYFINKDFKTIVLMAKELVSKMPTKTMSTVPFVNGENNNYNYSIYDSQDESILLTGAKTDACFRIDGNDNDFLHYCALDKNGFIIKITNHDGEFIGRASGFRNGNCVFINQLRTVYDKFGDIYLGNCESEKEEIIETFKKACEDIITTSQNNKSEECKIDFVFVTKSYALKNTSSNVPEDVCQKINSHPMDNESEDWHNFIKNTLYLDESVTDNYFYTDYGCYPLICMAKAKDKELTPEEIKPKDVPALYERKRNRLIVASAKNKNVMDKVNKINGINSYLNNKEYKNVKIDENSIIFTADNWYIIFDGEKIIDGKVLDFDEKAKIEFKIIKNIIDEFFTRQESREKNIKILRKNKPNS